MFDQSYGLRFDIYERIQLSEEVAGIAELEEVEMLPHIQVISQGDQATLRGHLILTGLYRGEGEESGTERLEHYIPVEITVPLNRVTSLDEIAVEIENFDVDLLSKRSLNITGVLSLRGIETLPSDAPSWNVEDFTVVHTPEWQVDHSEASRPPSEDVTLVHVNSSEEQTVERSQSEVSFAQDEFANEVIEANATVQNTEDEPARYKDHSNVWNIGFKDEDENSIVNEVSAETFLEEVKEPSPVNSLENELFEEDLNLADVATEITQSEENEEKAELRIGFGSKKEPSATPQDNVGLSSILTSSRSRTLRDQEQQAQEEQLIALEEEQNQSTSEDVQWKSLFLGGASEKTPFSKVRLCIVQREETLDLIADRYQLSPRELLLYNRLSEQTIEEGQILYIP